MAEHSREDRRILSYLRDHVADGERYFRSSRIAEGVGLTPKQVGARLSRLGERTDDLEITPWARSRSTTWRVVPR